VRRRNTPRLGRCDRGHLSFAPDPAHCRLHRRRGVGRYRAHFCPWRGAGRRPAIIVENKPGAGSSIAAQYVARAPKDGYTLFLPALSTLTNEIVNPSSPPLDMSKDFATIAQLAEGPFFLTVNPALGAHSVAELVALAKSKPGELSYGSVGAGSLPHLCGALFEQQAARLSGGIRFAILPYELPDARGAQS
jgi:hypothetical protein